MRSWQRGDLLPTPVLWVEECRYRLVGSLLLICLFPRNRLQACLSVLEGSRGMDAASAAGMLSSAVALPAGFPWWLSLSCETMKT